jgi:hypothetical protein
MDLTLDTILPGLLRVQTRSAALRLRCRHKQQAPAQAAEGLQQQPAALQMLVGHLRFLQACLVLPCACLRRMSWHFLQAAEQNSNKKATDRQQTSNS